jgi:hypothetical protein
MTTVFSFFAQRACFGRRALRGASLASLITAVLLVVGGGVVRVTGSGLGCPDWPTCADGLLAPTPAMGWHGVIEFGNRLLTGVLCAVVGWTIVVARLQRDEERRITRWAWIQFWIVLLNAVVGGLTVLARLSPYMVAAHFIAAMLLLTAAAVTREKVEGLSRLPETVDPQTRRLSVALTVATAFLVVVGTVTTGTGPGLIVGRAHATLLARRDGRARRSCGHLRRACDRPLAISAGSRGAPRSRTGLDLPRRLRVPDDDRHRPVVDVASRGDGRPALARCISHLGRCGPYLARGVVTIRPGSAQRVQGAGRANAAAP